MRADSTNSNQPFSIEQRAALMQLGFSVLVDIQSGRPDWLVRGFHRVVVRYGLGDDQWVYEPWTTYWNPGVQFTDPIAAVAWAEVEGWGDEFRDKNVDWSIAFKNASAG